MEMGDYRHSTDSSLLKQAGVEPNQAHRINGDTPEDFLADASLFAEQLGAARAMFRQHEQERKLLDERQYAAIEAALKTAQDSPWLDAEGCARYLGMGIKFVHARSGPNCHGPDALPVRRIGPNGQKRFHRDEIDDWIRKHG